MYSYKSISLRGGANSINVTDFAYQTTNRVMFDLYVTSSVVQEFCLSVVLLHFTNLKTFPLFNATHATQLPLSSVNPLETLEYAVETSFGLGDVYGPELDGKCVMGLMGLSMPSTLGEQELSFDFTSSPMAVTSTINSTYTAAYSTMCFVELQCQFLYQQYYVLINDCQNVCTLQNCTTCTTSSSCGQCATGYFVSSMLRCEKCIDNCDTCASALTCEKCRDEYFYNSTSMECLPCQAFCLECNMRSCLTCLTGYFSNNAECLSCHAYMPNCLVCSGSRACS